MNSSDALTTAGRSAHDLALAALIGGNLFGRWAMHPALTDVSDKSERGRVLNRAWRRYGTINSLALVALVAGWLPARRQAAGERRLTRAKDTAVGAVVLTGLASAAGGVGFAQQAPGGAVPMDSGRHPAPETPAKAARLKHLVNSLGALNLASEIVLLAVNSGARAPRPTAPRRPVRLGRGVRRP